MRSVASLFIGAAILILGAAFAAQALPPGIERKLDNGGSLPPGIAKKIDDPSAQRVGLDPPIDSAPAVPEPSAAMLYAAGFLTSAATLRRRRS
jgi:hypothetical protein